MTLLRKIYGGSVTENLCQWLARNVVFDQMLECEKRWGAYAKRDTGVVLTVHDEIVLCVDEDDAEEALVLDDRHAGDAAGLEELLEFAHGGIAADGDEVAGHDVADAQLVEQFEEQQRGLFRADGEGVHG